MAYSTDVSEYDIRLRNCCPLDEPEDRIYIFPSHTPVVRIENSVIKAKPNPA